MGLFGKAKKSGGHGNHWDTAFKETDPERKGLKDLVTESAKGRLVKSFQFNGKTLKGELAFFEKDFGDLTVSTIALNGGIGTSFPSFRAKLSHAAIVKSVEEWANEVEGQVSVKVFDAGLDFFATDYALNRERYAVGKELNVSLAALAYGLRVGSIASSEASGGRKFDENFTGTFPAGIVFKGKGFDIDDYQVYGIAEEVRKASFAGQDALILKAKIAGDKAWKLVIEIGVLAKNIEGAPPKKGDKITALIWMTGRIK